LRNFVTFNTKGLDFVLTALFVVLFLEQMKKSENRIFGIVGVACTVIALVIFGASNLVIPSMVLILLVLLVMGRKKICC